MLVLGPGMRTRIFSSDPDPAQLKKKSDPDQDPTPDPTLIQNKTKIFTYFNEKKYLYYSNSSPPIRSFGFIQEFS